MNKSENYVSKVGVFVLIGSLLFVITIYSIGATKNIFGESIHLQSNFTDVNGLKVGNNVRFSGINVGTVKSIYFVADTLVVVDFMIKKEVQKYIKTDATTSIGTDGLMGDKILIILPGTPTKNTVKENDAIKSSKALELADLTKSLKTSLEYTQITTQQLAQFSTALNNKNGVVNQLLSDEKLSKTISKTAANLESSSNELLGFSKRINSNKGVINALLTDEKMVVSVSKTLQNIEESSTELTLFTKNINSKKGVFSKLINDENLGKSVDTTITNIQTATESLNETMLALQNNFLLKGYFKKKKRLEERKKKMENKKP
jgi:phospholipid/cholesterol/gamma-HCH transport system substrate-binding protein